MCNFGFSERVEENVRGKHRLKASDTETFRSELGKFFSDAKSELVATLLTDERRDLEDGG